MGKPDQQSCDGEASNSSTEQEEEEGEGEGEVLSPNSILANPARFQALIKFGRSLQEFSQQVRYHIPGTFVTND
jgi:hypothetical protein